MCMSDSVMLCFVQGFDVNNKTKDGKDYNKQPKLQMVKKKLLLRKSRSSSNFGSIGVRSAPSTPHGLLGSSPGGLSENVSQPCSPPAYSTLIQRSPSHTVFSKYDKGALKQLSSSTPAMTAQARSPEPPSPKGSTKEDKLPTTSKARQKKFHRHFPAVDIEEKVLNYYSCALIGDILLQGHLYITKNYFAFYSNVFGYVTKLLIPLLSVQKITKEKTARIIPNAVGIATVEDKHVFGSLMSRDSTYRLMTKVWDAARNNAQTLEAELLAVNAPSECSDSTKSSESDTEFMVADSANGMVDSVDSSARMRRLPSLWPPLKSEHSSKVASDAESKKSNINHSFWHNFKILNLPTQTIVLCTCTLLLLLLFLSAAILLYRIGQVQQKYIMALQDNHVMGSTEDVYGELLQWQAQLHTKSAGAVHNFLDTNLDQIAKVRQSLEALSTLLMVSSNNNSVNRNPPTERMKSPEMS
ncbi:hypothetical protein RI129_001918 [Pyrocoelia pectoralis]|uniref:GRAM domain-containing protein n=1 Tax=Pyrocoelia pectoralis TaxID=417401 RepID=A0AAN7VVM3_9COLE